MNTIHLRAIARAALLGVLWIASGLSGLADEKPIRQANKTPSADGKTVIPKTTLDQLDEQLDVAFAQYGDRTLLMDIYRPQKANGPLPAIVCIHGGGWRKGSKIHHRKVAQALAAEGFVTASIDYRLSGEAIFPAHIHDCKAAVRYLRANAKRLGIDAEHIGAIGHSAGGHLAALLATSGGVGQLEGDGGNEKVSSAIQAVVPMGGQTDFLSQRNREKSAAADIWQKFLGGSQDEVRETYRLASPLAHLDKNDPPVWLISGEKDDPSTHGDSLRKKMDAFGIPNGLTIIKGAPHPFTVQQNWFDEMMDAAVPFFNRTLKKQTANTDDTKE
ncbi:MAG: alpha/beta fold hydrolase [Rubripirellula sp.]